MNKCRTCELTARRDDGTAPFWDNIYRTAYWDVVHSYNTELSGWLVIVSRRHLEAIAEMNPDEAVVLGRLLRNVSLAVQQVTGCLKTYVLQFAEHPDHPHVHFHVVPRMSNQPEARKATKVMAYLNVDEARRVTDAEMNHISEKILEKLLLLENHE